MNTSGRKAFTLIELLVATVIFSFMLLSLTAIFSTANNHLFQSYRQNTVKSNLSVGMKAITTMLTMANRLDIPAPGESGNVLALAVNVDHKSGCYPMNRNELAHWHYLCYVRPVTAQCPTGGCLFYHAGFITGGNGCPVSAKIEDVWEPVRPMYAPVPMLPAYPVVGCGIKSSDNELVTLVANYIEAPDGSPIFTRHAAGNEDLIDVRLRVMWDPANAAGGKFKTAAGVTTAVRKIDTALETTVRINSGAR